MLIHGAHDVVDASLVLQKTQLEVVCEGAVTTYGGKRHGSHGEYADHSPIGCPDRELHVEVSELDGFARNCSCWKMVQKN